MERALIVSEGGLLTAAQFGIVGTGDHRGAEADDRATGDSVPGSLADMEKRSILSALERVKGNKSKAAAALGITRTQLYTRLRRFGLRE